MLALIIFMVIILVVIINNNKIYISSTKYININSNIVMILFLVSLLCVNNYYERFSLIPENNVIGITGPSTMDNLQKVQDKDIQNLESLYNSVRKIYRTKQEKIDSDKYAKIPIKSSCRNINSAETTYQDLSYRQNTKPLPNINNALTRQNLLDIISKSRVSRAALSQQQDLLQRMDRSESGLIES